MADHSGPIQSIADLREQAVAWDDLWQRSNLATPTLRAELLAQWLEQFAAGQRLCAVTVTEGDRLVAALPLVSGRLRRVLPVGSQPVNPWSPGGDLLLDPGCDVPRVIDMLLDRLNHQRWPLIRLDAVTTGSPHWHALIAGLDRAGMAYDIHHHHDVGRVAVGRDWDAYEKSWSKNHRGHMRKALNRVEREGGVEVRLLTSLRPEEVESTLQECFAIEDRSWKGAEGSSILRTPGMAAFYYRQARQLAEWGQLQVALLEHKGTPVAFHYAWVAKGVYHPFKVGYDAAFSSWSPGQLLWRFLLERFHAEGTIRMVDMVGPLADATGKWVTETYSEDRLLIAPRRPGSRAALRTYQRLAAAARRSRERRAERTVAAASPSQPESTEKPADVVPIGTATTDGPRTSVDPVQP